MSAENEVLKCLTPIVGLVCATGVVITALNNGVNGVIVSGFLAFVGAVIGGGIGYTVGKRAA